MTRQTEIEVKLLDPIKIGVGGSQQEVDVITLVAPSSKNRKAAGRLKRLCGSTLKAEIDKASQDGAKAKAKEDDNDEPIKWRDMINLLSMATDADEDLFDKLYQSLQVLFENGCAHAKGEKITSYIFDLFSFDDLERMLGEYVANFLLKSLNQKDGEE
jgi:hypothetical protein